MKEQGNIKERLIKAIQKDPHILGIVWNIRLEGMHNLTDYGTIILIYNNRKTGISVIIDPAKPTIHIKDTKTNEGFNIHIPLAIKTVEETYGIPEVEEIPKFFTNIPLSKGKPDPKNIP